MADPISILIDGSDVSTPAQAAGSGNDPNSGAVVGSKLVFLLRAVGILTAAMAVAAAMFRSPPPGTFVARGHGIGFYACLGGAFAAGVAEVCAAQWLANDVATRCAAGRKLLSAAVVPFVLVGVLGGFTVQLKY